MNSASTQNTGTQGPPGLGRDADVRLIDLDPRARAAGRTLADAIVRHLERPAIGRLVPGMFAELLKGGLTGGMWPAASLALRLREIARWHRRGSDETAAWVRLHVGQDSAQKVEAASRPRWARELAGAGFGVALLAALVGMIVIFEGPRAAMWGMLVRPDPWGRLVMPEGIWIFTGLVTAACALTLLGANSMLLSLRRWVRAVDEATGQPYKAPLARVELGLTAWSVIFGVLLAWAGFIWAVPVLLTTAAVRRVAKVHARHADVQVATAVRRWMAGYRPMHPSPPVVDRFEPCARPRCSGLMPPDARFCPRCGKPQPRWLRDAA